MGCINSIYPSGGLIAIIVYSDKRKEESKKLIDFCKYFNIDYKISNLENFVEDACPDSIGIEIDGKFFSYDYFLENHLEIAKIFEEVKEAHKVAKLCFEGKYKV